MLFKEYLEALKERKLRQHGQITENITALHARKKAIADEITEVVELLAVADQLPPNVQAILQKILAEAEQDVAPDNGGQG